MKHCKFTRAEELMINRFETALIADSVMMQRFGVHLNSFSAYMYFILLVGRKGGGGMAHR